MKIVYERGDRVFYDAPNKLGVTPDMVSIVIRVVGGLTILVCPEVGARLKAKPHQFLPCASTVRSAKVVQYVKGEVKCH